MTLTFLAQSASEPAPSTTVGIVDTVLKHADTPVFFPLLCAVIPCAAVAGLVYLAFKYGLPALEKHAAASRQLTIDLVAARSKDAAEDAAAARKLADVQQAAIVDKLGGEMSRVTGSIEKISDKLDRHGEALARVAAGLAAKGIGALLLVLLVAFGAHRVRLATSEPAHRCSPPCAAGQRCTKDGCKEIKTDTASRPTSALHFQSIASLAADSCQRSSTACP